MRLSKLFKSMMALVALTLAAPAPAGVFECNGSSAQTIDLTIQRKNPVVLKGPAEVTLQPLNRLRYDVVIANEVVSSPGPDLSVLGLIPTFPAAVKTAAAKETPAPPPPAGSNAARVQTAIESKVEAQVVRALADVPGRQPSRYEDVLRRFLNELKTRPLSGLVEWAAAWRDPLGRAELLPEHVVEQVFTRLQAEIATAEGNLDQVRQQATKIKLDLERERDRLLDLVQRSDQILASHYPRTRPLVDEINRLLPSVESAIQAPWPQTDVDALAKNLRLIESELEKLPRRLPGFASWQATCDPLKGVCNLGRYDSAENDVEALTEGLAVFAQGSDIWRAQNELRAGLQTWLPQLRSLQSARSFAKTHSVACDYPFFQSRTTTLQVVLTDRLEKDKSKATRTIQVAEIVCPSHFSVTAGVGVARIEERDIAFVSAPAPPPPAEDEPEDDGEEDGEENDLTKVFGFDNRSEEQINPTFLISTRLCQNRTWELHVSFGTILDFDRPKESAVFGYLGGLTASIKDQLFVTLGVQAQRVPELAGGFVFGQEVPADLTAPPLEKDWDFGPVLAVTYKVN